jgi:predicted nucleic acid-binding protein
MAARAVVLDTNVFVGAAFNRRSASARIVLRVRSGELPMVWNEETRAETEYILTKIPRMSWSDAAELFRAEDRWGGETRPERFEFVADASDRKFAALASTAGAVLITNDEHLLSANGREGLEAVRPAEWDRGEG